MTPATIYLDPADNYYSIRDRIALSGAKRVLLVLPDLEDPLLDSTDLALLRRLTEHDHLRLALVTPDRALRRQARDFGLPAYRSQMVGRRGVARAGRPRVRLGFGPAEDRRPPDQQPHGWGRLSAEQRIARLAQAAFVALLSLTVVLVLLAGRPAAAPPPAPAAPIPLSATALLHIRLDDTLPVAPATAAGPTITIPGRLLRLEQRWDVAGSGTDDEATLRQQALLGLATAAPGLLAERVGPSELVLAGSPVVRGGASELLTPDDGPVLLRLGAVLTATVVSRADVTRAALEALDAAAPPGTAIDPGSVRVLPGTYDPLTASVVIGATGTAAEDE